jgi:hypothetical protein
MSPYLMYILDFETIKQMMQSYRQTGFLSADVPSGVGSLREPCRIEINIMSGIIASCAIVGRSGRRLTGKEATRELSRLGRLSWTFTPQQEVVTLPELPSEEISLPCRALLLEQKQMRNFSRFHRAVFALADGTKSSVKIAEMLSTSQDLVDKALSDLQSIGVIAFRRQDGKDRM